MLMKIEHKNLRTAPAPPRVARATSPTRWATCPAKDRDLRMARTPRSNRSLFLPPFRTGGCRLEQAGSLCCPSGAATKPSNTFRPVQVHCIIRPVLGLGLVEYLTPDFSTTLRTIKKARIPAYSRIFQPFTPGGGGIKCLILYSFMSPRVASCRNMSEYVGKNLLFSRPCARNHDSPTPRAGKSQIVDCDNLQFPT